MPADNAHGHREIIVISLTRPVTFQLYKLKFDILHS